jgi:hypothetical protein
LALLLDNDVVDKLAQLDLLQETKTLLISKFGQLVILDTLKYKLCPRKESKRKKRNAIVMSRIENFIKEDIIEINCVIKDEDLINALTINPNKLDEEMQLLQALFECENELLFTGDKEFLRAISKFDFLDGKLKQISGSVICFEQIIYFLIKSLGFEQVKEKYIQALEAGIRVDSALRVCFEGRHLAVEERVIELLIMYISEIRNESGQLLSVSEEWLPK